MPVVRISALPQRSGADLSGLMQRLCVRLAQLDNVEPRHWWAIWQPITPEGYVEGDVSAPPIQPSDSHPPLVDIQAFTGREPETIEQLLENTAAILADGLGMEPGNVFVTWTELQPGSVFTGGSVRR